jgi:V/A-type H+/Na+-transporting ATPase subunit I
MFKPVAMTRLSVVVLERDERTLLRELGRAGVMQLTRTVAGPETAPLMPRNCSADLARLERFSLRLGSLRQALELPVAPPDQTELPEISLDEAEQNLRRMEDQSSVPLKRRQELLERIGELTAVGEQLSGYRELAIPLDRPDESSFLHFVTGTLPAENLGKLEVGDSAALLPMLERNGRQLLVAMTTRQNRAALERALQQAGFQAEILPVAAGATTETMTEQSRREREQITAELQPVNTALQKFAGEFGPSLDRIEQLVSIERRLLEAEQNFPRTETAILLTGWIPSQVTPAWEQRLREITGGRCAIATAVPEKTDTEQIPVLLQHPRWLRPFEMLVSTYALPGYRELEPTLIVAVSYLLMFGMMFGDVGDGFILAAGGWAAWRLGRTKLWHDAGLLLLFGGLASMTFGVIYGSYFGIPALKSYALWHDPLAGDAMGFLTTSIEIGIVMISLGLILNVLNRFRRGDGIGGCMDKFGLAGMLFFWGMLALIVNYATFQSHDLVKAAFILFFAVPLLCWALKEPVQYFRCRHASHPPVPGHGLLAVLIESLVEVFEGVLSYFSNTISFVRLAAYSMSHAALLAATFMVAADVRHFSPGGGLLAIAVIVVGNLFALVLEGIICAVQALRLEYYEFFGKFFFGGGQPFKPFRLLSGSEAAIG